MKAKHYVAIFAILNIGCNLLKAILLILIKANLHLQNLLLEGYSTESFLLGLPPKNTLKLSFNDLIS